ncbi:hypothetical protein F5I97DRAFT_1548033 [Phlebopus sp. FC_14]|nr:hypothetical protein F5I97DRAFT_1548033 [Phlebopus sp. FC_14]
MFWSRGTDDLRGYLKDAVLPAIRALTGICNIGASFDSAANEWITTNVPDRSLGILDKEQESGEQLTVPSASKFAISSAVPAPVTCFSRLCSWVDHFPLQTVERVLHIIFPASKRWTFVRDNRQHPDDHIFQEFCFTDTVTSPASPENAVIVACQPPWVLDRADMFHFAALKTLPNCHRRLRRKERLWAKLWEECRRKKCYYFIVTSYRQWIFGVFSGGRTNAFVSPPLDAGSREPTVLQAMLYWLASALGLGDGFQPPEVSESVNFMLGQFCVPSSDLGHVASAQNSSSSWEGKSEASVSERSTSEGDYSDPITYIKPRDPIATRQMVEQWRSTVSAGRRKGRGIKESNSSRYIPDPPQVSQPTVDLVGNDDAFTTASSDHPDEGNTTGHWLAS